MTAHARLSPSAAEAWMTCPGYPNAVEGLPNDSSEAAAEGTAAHSISDICLTLGMEPHDFIGMTTKVEQWSFEWTADDADEMQFGLDQIRDFGGLFFGEHRVDLSHWLGANQFGTLDRGVVLSDLIVIGDLKWGRGVPVSPVENKQLSIYALGFWQNIARHHTDATKFLFIIDQPRCGGGGGEWWTTLDELRAFGEDARRAAARTLEPDAPRIASAKGCYWCRRRQAPGGCGVYDAFNLATMSAKFDDLDDDDTSLELPRDLTPERRTYVLQHAKMITTWLDDLRAEAIGDALAGRPVPGLKVIAGRQGPRKFADPAAADSSLAPVLGSARFAAPKLKTPTQLEKEIDPEEYAEFVAPLVTRADAKPALVPEADARPALPTAQSKMDEEED